MKFIILTVRVVSPIVLFQYGINNNQFCSITYGEFPVSSENNKIELSYIKLKVFDQKEAKDFYNNYKKGDFIIISGELSEATLYDQEYSIDVSYSFKNNPYVVADKREEYHLDLDTYISEYHDSEIYISVLKTELDN